MKIHAYEVRNDEIPYFNQMKEKLGVEITLSPECLSMENLESTKGYDAVTTIGHSQMTKEVMKGLSENGVKAYATRCIGYNHIDLEAAKQYGVRVCNATYGPNGVADYTLMLILLCLRSYKQALWRRHVNDFSLTGLQGREMKDLVVGVIGTGRIGEAVIKNLSGFGCRILAYDVYQKESVKGYGDYVSLEKLYEESDIITLHAPLQDSTYRMINEDSIKRMKDGVVLINCARGELMDIDALIKGIEEEKIGALGMDVFENEEGIYHHDRKTDILSNRNMAYLQQFKNVVMTQHMAFYTDAAVKSMVIMALEGIVSMVDGKECSTLLV